MMLVKAHYQRLALAILASQLLLGCRQVEKDEFPLVPTVSVPTRLEHPDALAGKWLEAKGKQTVQLNGDGSCLIVSKVSIGADVTKGAAQSFDQKIDAKWGVKETTFYFTEIKGSGPLSYDWVLASGKLLLSNGGSKLSYSQIKEKPKA